jgi:hypothetical protein
MLHQSEAARHQPHLLSIFKSTRGIIFLGCPHRGANLADWGLILGHLSRIAFGSTNKKLIRSLQTNAGILDPINAAFANYLKENRFKVHSFLEEKGMLGQHGILGKVRRSDKLFKSLMFNIGVIGSGTILLCHWRCCRRKGGNQRKPHGYGGIRKSP